MMWKSRIGATLVVLAAIGWIASGELSGDSRVPETAPAQDRPVAPFRVATQTLDLADHRRTIIMSGRTEADRRATAVTRATGVVTALNVRRGDRVATGDVIATLSDEAREAQVAQARARFAQRKAEHDARLRLIESGNLPALGRAQIEADLKEAEAALAQAEAELRRAEVLAPISGVVDVVPVQLGQALKDGATVAEIIALDPMLVVFEIPETRLGAVRTGDVADVRLATGQTARGEVRFISQRASETTRTYRVEVAIDNAAAGISDGVTAEVALRLAPVPAAQVPRSALTFSSAGELGLRHVLPDGRVAFAPVSIVEDGRDAIWVAGAPDRARAIIQGQDFVTEGQIVEAVPTPAVVSAER
ncbi:MAG: efflux RND transporter periplasmic adaptor subunit [Salinarimonadaceae bacterium]|nr:MAG: efflux RND transporter periplasmic adaptor subunit [Salinarimonadaceae bacterium]